MSNLYYWCFIYLYYDFRVIDPTGHVSRRRSMSASSRHGHNDHLKPVTETPENLGSSDESDNDTTASVGPPGIRRDDLINPYWIEDPDVGKGEVEHLNSNELQFWKDLLEKYLYPLDENKEEKVKEDGSKELRYRFLR